MKKIFAVAVLLVSSLWAQANDGSYKTLPIKGSETKVKIQDFVEGSPRSPGVIFSDFKIEKKGNDSFLSFVAVYHEGSKYNIKLDWLDESGVMTKTKSIDSKYLVTNEKTLIKFKLESPDAKGTWRIRRDLD